MAKSLYTIQMDFKKANDCATKLEEAANQIKKMANNSFQTDISIIANDWKSDNAEAYVKKCNTVKNRMTNISDKLMKNADTIRKIAERTYRADLSARQVALTRKYK